MNMLNHSDAHTLIADAVENGQPFAMGKLGGTETRALYHSERLIQTELIYSLSWKKYAKQLYLLSGVYPIDRTIFKNFCTLYKNSVIPQCDFIFHWQNSIKEQFLLKKYGSTLSTTNGYLSHYSSKSWIGALKNKRVLVISPFSRTIEFQQKKLEQIWQRVPELAVNFEVLTLSCPLYSHLVPPTSPDWFSALDLMTAKMASLDFDVLLVGAGAWGLPLAVAAKAQGKIGIHLGGSLQLLFGIKGGRWDSYNDLYNDAWVYPSEEETPPGVQIIEGGCYWRP